MNKRILCAEDDGGIRDLLVAKFSEEGHSVHAVSNGLEALDAAQTTDFDILITDHQMPLMDGLALVRRLRNLAFRGRIFIFSGALPVENQKAYVDLKVDAIVAKPGELGLLSTLIQGRMSMQNATG